MQLEKILDTKVCPGQLLRCRVVSLTVEHQDIIDIIVDGQFGKPLNRKQLRNAIVSLDFTVKEGICGVTCRNPNAKEITIISSDVVSTRFMLHKKYTYNVRRDDVNWSSFLCVGVTVSNPTA